MNSLAGLALTCMLAQSQPVYVPIKGTTLDMVQGGMVLVMSEDLLPRHITVSNTGGSEEVERFSYVPYRHILSYTVGGDVQSVSLLENNDVIDTMRFRRQEERGRLHLDYTLKHRLANREEETLTYELLITKHDGTQERFQNRIVMHFFEDF